MARPPANGLTRRLTRIGTLAVLFSALIAAGGIVAGGTFAIFACAIGGIGALLGLFVAVTAGLRIGPGATPPQGRPGAP